VLDVLFGDNTLSANPLLPYVVQDVRVAAGHTLTLEPGVVMKSSTIASRGGSLIGVNGTLLAQGTADSPVCLTSLHDDQVAGDTNNNGDASRPAAGDWFGVGVNPGGTVNLAYCTLRYAGSGDVALLNTGGTVTVDHSTISYSAGHGLGNKEGGALTVTNSRILYNMGAGLNNTAAGPAVVRITYSDIVGNQTYGVASNRPLGDWITATNNYWGAADGPTNPPDLYCNPAPTGHGDQVTCHNVTWFPFATTPYFGN